MIHNEDTAEILNKAYMSQSVELKIVNNMPSYLLFSLPETRIIHYDHYFKQWFDRNGKQVNFFEWYYGNGRIEIAEKEQTKMESKGLSNWEMIQKALTDETIWLHSDGKRLPVHFSTKDKTWIDIEGDEIDFDGWYSSDDTLTMFRKV